MTGTILGYYTYSMRTTLPTLPGMSRQVCEIHGFVERAAVGGDVQVFQTSFQENLGLLPSSGSDACESGKTVMFAKMYERFRQPIHSHSYRLLCNREDADDVTQQVFLRTYQAWDGLYARDDLSAWLYRLATNFSIDLLRRRRLISWQSLGWHQHKDASSESGGDEENPHWPPESGGIPDIAEREHIRLALANLPEQYAVVLVLSAAQGVPYQEIATILDISPQAAATRISRAKRMFAEQYQRLSEL